MPSFPSVLNVIGFNDKHLLHLADCNRRGNHSVFCHIGFIVAHIGHIADDQSGGIDIAVAGGEQLIGVSNGGRGA